MTNQDLLHWLNVQRKHWPRDLGIRVDIAPFWRIAEYQGKAFDLSLFCNSERKVEK